MTILINASDICFYNDKLNRDGLYGKTFIVTSVASTKDGFELTLRDWESFTVSHTLLTDKNGKVRTVENWQKIALDKYKQRVRGVLEKVSSYKSEVHDLINVGRQNALDDLEKELKKVVDEE